MRYPFGKTFGAHNWEPSQLSTAWQQSRPNTQKLKFAYRDACDDIRSNYLTPSVGGKIWNEYFNVERFISNRWGNPAIKPHPLNA
ncbi:MAG TPA: hypothetical protein VF602_09860 [Pedobacter sp.]